MNIQAKMHYAKTAIESIARDATDPAARDAALQHLVAVIVYETQQAQARAPAPEAA